MGPVAIITGSARRDGNTRAAVEALVAVLGSAAREHDLAKLDLRPFDYARQNDGDGFGPIIEGMVASEHVVFATPVYWYAMSGVMKTFFDRLTDLVMRAENRPLGRALAGRHVWLLATGTDEALPPGFAEPFARTAAYFDMEWQGAFYCRAIGGEPLTEEGSGPARELGRSILAAP